jgi:hypothetical protein
MIKDFYDVGELVKWFFIERKGRIGWYGWHKEIF